MNSSIDQPTSRTDTNAKMSCGVGGGDADGMTKQAMINDDETTLNLDEDFTKSLLTPAPVCQQRNATPSASLVINENSTSNDETLTMTSLNVATAKPDVAVNPNLNVELNQLIEELIESVVESVKASEAEKTELVRTDQDNLDAAVREVLDSLLDQIEARLIENRALDDESAEPTCDHDDESLYLLKSGMPRFFNL